MITLISGTNRSGSNTRQITDVIAEMYRKSGVQTQIYDLCHLPRDVAFSEVFGQRSEAFGKDIEKFVVNVDKFVFVAPEYNGSFPGILKVFLDAVEPRQWYGKKAALVGLATGRSGNLRGLDHLMGVLNYLQMDVLHFKPNLSHLVHHPQSLELPKVYEALLERQVELFLEF